MDTLEEAVEGAVTEEDGTTEETTSEETGTTEEATEEIEPTAEEQAEADTVAKARILYDALNDPTKSVATLHSLMAQAGIKIPTTEETTAEEVSEVSEIIKKHLGDDYKFFSGKLGDALDEALDAAVEKRLTKVNERFDADTRERKAETVDAAMETVFGKYENSSDKKIQAKILELQNDFEIKPGTKPERYFQLLINSASAELGIPLIKKGRVDASRIKRNRNDAGSRLASASTGGEGTSATGKPMNLDEAVSAAAKSESEK